jgi:hypothetical protein
VLALSGGAAKVVMLCLVLHSIDDPSKTRGTTLRHSRSLARYSPDMSVFYHHALDPVTDHLRRIEFDVIVLDATFLCHRWTRPQSEFEALRTKYRWLAETQACKLAFPQDDYDHGQLLDDWLSECGVNVIYSILPEHRELIYRKCTHSAKVKFALCGYIDDEDVEHYRSVRKSFAERTIDVGYRVRDLPAQFGRFGRIKSTLGTAFVSAAQGRGLELDITVGEGGTLVGRQWSEFLGNCRFSLGSEGGSSVFDPVGLIKDRIDALRLENPGASEDDLVRMGLSEKDEQTTFAMATPRIFEIAMAASCPVLVKGRYLDLLAPDEHYIPVEKDFSNLEAVLDAMSDRARAERMANATAETLLSVPDLRYSRWVEGVLGDIEELLRGIPRQRTPLPSAIAMFGAHVEEGRAMATARAHDAYREIERLSRAVEEAASGAVYVQRDDAYREISRLSLAFEELKALHEATQRSYSEVQAQLEETHRLRGEMDAAQSRADGEIERLKSEKSAAFTDLEDTLHVVETLRRHIESYSWLRSVSKEVWTQLQGGLGRALSLRRSTFDMSPMRTAPKPAKVGQQMSPPVSAKRVQAFGPADIVVYDFWRGAGATADLVRGAARITTPVAPWHYSAGVVISLDDVDFAGEYCWARLRVRAVRGDIRVSLFDADTDALSFEREVGKGDREQEIMLTLPHPGGGLFLFRNGATEGPHSCDFISLEILTAPR